MFLPPRNERQRKQILDGYYQYYRYDDDGGNGNDYGYSNSNNAASTANGTNGRNNHRRKKSMVSPETLRQLQANNNNNNNNHKQSIETAARTTSTTTAKKTTKKTTTTTTTMCDEFWNGEDCSRGYRQMFVAYTWNFTDGSCLFQPEDCNNNVFFYPNCLTTVDDDDDDGEEEGTSIMKARNGIDSENVKRSDKNSNNTKKRAVWTKEFLNYRPIWCGKLGQREETQGPSSEKNMETELSSSKPAEEFSTMEASTSSEATDTTKAAKSLLKYRQAQDFLIISRDESMHPNTDESTEGSRNTNNNDNGNIDDRNVNAQELIWKQANSIQWVTMLVCLIFAMISASFYCFYYRRQHYHYRRYCFFFLFRTIDAADY